MALLTLWALLLNLTTAALFEILKVHLGRWVELHQPFPLIGGMVLFLLLCYSFAILLAAGMTGSMDDIRRFTLVLPITAQGDHVGIAPVRNYWVTGRLRRRLDAVDPARLLEAYAKAWEANRGRPISGQFYKFLADVIVAELLDSLKHSCEFLLSKSAEFHGVDYSDLAQPRGPCHPVEVTGAPDARVRLPHGDTIMVESAPPDRYGKSGRRVSIRGRYATITFDVWPQWPLLSKDYHAPHLNFALQRLEPLKQVLPVNPSAREPALWVWEAPILVRVRFRNWLWPFAFLSSRFELYAEWVGELLERFEVHWSWEGFAEHAPASDEEAIGS